MSTNDPAPFGSQNDDHVNPFAEPRAVDQPGDFEPVLAGDLTLNPWLSIWTQPRKTIRQIVDSDPGYNFLLVVCLYGIGVALGQSGYVINGLLSLWAFCVLVVLAGPVIGLVLIALIAWVIGLCCWPFGGAARGSEMRVAMAWSSVPYIWMLPVSLGITAYMITTFQDPEVFQQDPMMMFRSPVVIAGWVFGTIVWFWTMFITVNTVAEVNRFEWWKALLAIVLSWLLFIVLVFVLSFAMVIVMFVFLGTGL